MQLKGKFYKVAIRPALLYGSECWAIKKEHKRKMEVAEMRMLRWISGKTLWDLVPNASIRSSLGVATITEKLREGRLRWLGHVHRRQPLEPVRRVESISVDGVRGRGRPKKKWDDCLSCDMKVLDITVDMTADRKMWRQRTKVVE